MSSKCDKCGTEVPVTNDVTVFEAIRTGDPTYYLAFSRHLLPVIVDGETICAGSPSRAQYIEGQPRDSRGDYPYNVGGESEMRATYAKLIETAPVS